MLVLERDLEEPDRIVGELLQPGGFLKLVELGMEGGQASRVQEPEYGGSQRLGLSGETDGGGSNVNRVRNEVSGCGWGNRTGRMGRVVRRDGRMA